MSWIQKINQNRSLIESLKLGTEVEDCSFEEIKYIVDEVASKIPITLKIGGVEARQDMRFSLSLKGGINKILAPMVESEYGFNNFMSVISNLEAEYQQPIQKAFNIETITCVKNLESIIASPYFRNLDSVTIGRSDLSQSMGLKSVDDPEVDKVVQSIITQLSSSQKPISIGGSLTNKSYALFSNLKYPLLSCNTRHIIMPLKNIKNKEDFTRGLNTILGIEVLLYQDLMKLFPTRVSLFEKRIETINNRLR